MPNDNPSRSRFLAETETLLHVLALYGAGGITAFGWAMGALLGLDATPWLPLWFCAALLIYNVDRLRLDPTDEVNVPQRAAACLRWHGVICGVVVFAAVGVSALPIWRRDWLTLGLVVAGSLICLGYSVPIFGRRWKDVPLLKTLFAPMIVTVAIFGLLLRGEAGSWTLVFMQTHPPVFFLFIKSILVLSLWAFCYLLFNMLLCDLRDSSGDRRCGIRSIPVVLGKTGTRKLLWALVVTGQILLALGASRLGQAPFLTALLALTTGFYQAWLLQTTRRPLNERFHEWAVEGLLYVPPLVVALDSRT